MRKYIRRFFMWLMDWKYPHATFRQGNHPIAWYVWQDGEHRLVIEEMASVCEPRGGENEGYGCF